MNVVFLPKARQELIEAVVFYDQQNKGLGSLFLRECFEAIEIIRLYPSGCQLITKKTRKCLLRRFPYMVLYGIVGGEIVISAIAHQHRRPDSYLS
nr:Plasmid stabilization system protein [uncultured bacterium]